MDKCFVHDPVSEHRHIDTCFSDLLFTAAVIATPEQGHQGMVLQGLFGRLDPWLRHPRWKFGGCEDDCHGPLRHGLFPQGIPQARRYVLPRASTVLGVVLGVEMVTHVIDQRVRPTAILCVAGAVQMLRGEALI